MEKPMKIHVLEVYFGKPPSAKHGAGRFTYMIYGDFLANVLLFFCDPSAHNGAGIESYLAT